MILCWCEMCRVFLFFFFFQAEDGIRDATVTGVQTCALPISYLLARVGVVNAKMLARNRKYAILGAFIAGAVLTPTPDAFNQTLMAGPLILLYEVGIICARIFGRKPAPAPEPTPAESA